MTTRTTYGVPAPGTHAPVRPDRIARRRRKGAVAGLREAIAGIVAARGTGDDYVWQTSAFRYIRWSLSLVGFLVYIFVVVTYRLPVADIGMASALVGLILLRQPLRVPPVVLGTGALYLWGWVTLATSSYPSEVITELKTLGKLLLILLVAVNVLRSRAEIRLYLVLFLLFYATYPARGAIFNYLGGYTKFGRALWNYVYANSNDLAVITLLVLAMAACLLITERQKWFRLGAFASLVVLTVVILMTKSRGVFLGLAVFGIFALLPQLKRMRGIAISAVILAGVLMLAPSDSFSRLGTLNKVADTGTLNEMDDQGSALQRYTIWRVAWAIIQDHPITGVGWGAYKKAHMVYSPRVDPTGISSGGRDTHSTYFNVAAEMGLPGAAIFLAIIIETFARAERARRRSRATMPRAAQQLFYLELGLLAFLVAGTFGSYSRISFLYLYLALIYAVAQACDDDMDRLRGGKRRAFRTS